MKKRPSQQILLSEVQLFLAEKRTYFPLLRTGLAVFGLPLTILAFLVATIGYHNIFDIPWVATFSVVILALVSLIGLYVTY